MTTFTLPTSRPVTQAWGAEFDDWDGDGIADYPGGFYHSIGWLGHNGIDYGCYVGDPVEAVCDGVIEYVGPGNNHPLLTGGGNTILLRNDDLGIRFEYLHLSQQNVYTGQRVTVGQVIGLSGNSGAATAPHLHLGAIPVGVVNQNDGWRGRVDPTPYLYGAMNPDYPGGVAAQGTITPLSEEDDMPTPEDLWKHKLSLDGQLFEAGDILVYARKNAEGAKNNAETAAIKSTSALAAAQAAPGLAVQVLLNTKLKAPDGSGKEYTIADYLVFGWWYAMQAKDKPQGQPMDLAELNKAINESVANIVPDLQITMKETPHG